MPSCGTKKMAKGGEVKNKTEAKKPTPVFDKKMKPEDMPPNKAAMDMMREWDDKEKRRKMGERYEQIMPPSGLAKGGAVKKKMAKGGVAVNMPKKRGK